MCGLTTCAIMGITIKSESCTNSTLLLVANFGRNVILVYFCPLLRSSRYGVTTYIGVRSWASSWKLDFAKIILCSWRLILVEISYSLDQLLLWMFAWLFWLLVICFGHWYLFICNLANGSCGGAIVMVVVEFWW